MTVLRNSADASERALTIDELADLREKTEAVATLLQRRLTEQLETLRPIFAPRRIFGRYVRSGVREEVPGAERAYAAIRERYVLACGRPFSLSKDLDDEPLAIEPILDLYPFEYAHRLGGEGSRLVTMTNPVTWIMNYRSGYSLRELELALENRSALRPGDARQFVLGALALQLLLETFPEIGRLLKELRYDVTIEKREHLGELPLIVLRAPVPAFRPADPIIDRATRFSGVPAFIELIDVSGLEQLKDPLVSQWSKALR
jgi:hypothetical protein